MSRRPGNEGNDSVTFALFKYGKDWMLEGICNNNYPDNLWFNEGDEMKAIGICARCPVKVTCLEYAILAEEPLGVWGGYTTGERKRIKRKRKKEAEMAALDTPVEVGDSRPEQDSGERATFRQTTKEEQESQAIKKEE